MGELIGVAAVLGAVLLACWLVNRVLGTKRATGPVPADAAAPADPASDDQTPGPAGSEPGSEPGRYRVRGDALLTQAELNFARHLERAARLLLDELGPLRLVAKVNLADLIEPDCRRGPPGSDESRRHRGWRNSIDRKHADFVVVDDQWRPVCVVELDDGTHRRPRNKKRDEVKTAALESAGLPLVRCEGAETLNAEMVAERLRQAISPAANESVQPA